MTSAGGEAEDAKLWTCPICCDLLYKPCVNACGHLFCFWCLHKSMSPYSRSHCPICRQNFGHFPAVCGKLHRLLQRHLPDSYAERQREAAVEERELGLSPDDLGPPPSPASTYEQAELLCDSPTCQQLLYLPVVLNCGHVVCKGHMATGSGAGVCPACAHSIPAVPAVCKQLDELLHQHFPAAQAQRAQEAAAGAASRNEARHAAFTEPLIAAASGAAAAATPAEGGVSTGATVAAGPEQRQQAAAGRAQMPEERLGGAGSGAASSIPLGGSDSAEPTTPRGTPPEGAEPSAALLSPSLLSAIQSRRGEGSAMAQRLEENLRNHTGANYVHYGVGCDICGMYPIQGRRYQCKDCPDAVGFDLCGRCWDQGPPPGLGRFNQRHTAEHHMELVRPRITGLHLLQAANPELSMEQLVWLLELAMGRGHDEEAGPPGPQPGSPQGQQQHLEHQQEGEREAGQRGGRGEAEEGGEEVAIPMPSWRGPRPAPDPTAEEPSPSAIPGLAGGTGAGAQAGERGGEGEGASDTSLVFIPLEAVAAMLTGDEQENNVQAEEGEGPGEQQLGPQQEQPNQQREQ